MRTTSSSSGHDWWTNNSVLSLRNPTDTAMEERVAKLESMVCKGARFLSAAL